MSSSDTVRLTAESRTAGGRSAGGGGGTRDRGRHRHRHRHRRRRRRLPFWAELPLLLLVAAAVTVLVQGFVVRIFVVPSGSMERTLHGCPGCDNDRVAVDKLGYRFTDPAPGDVVVFRGPAAWVSNGEVSTSRPKDPVVRTLLEIYAYASLSEPYEKDFVKRVVAVGGQTVSCCDPENRVVVDGKPVAEPYVYLQPGGPPRQAPFDPVTLGPGQIWAMGDNRNNSADSREHGPITTADVIGKVRFVVLPVDRWRSVDG
ncbi:signal peptidase I [Pseudonocardia endophytica]|uniref:Signal peptidase I n=1 Tax=Pseudonocardia endophytica TaxID=401976 RepID=A0A4R1HIX6_PSEEN|nr:signal peptidase I [Pseudonocardia endophytica]TCK20921.1 signal peptidase I [Pseudonocardia endophytica]